MSGRLPGQWASATKSSGDGAGRGVGNSRRAISQCQPVRLLGLRQI